MAGAGGVIVEAATVRRGLIARHPVALHPEQAGAKQEADGTGCRASDEALGAFARVLANQEGTAR